MQRKENTMSNHHVYKKVEVVGSSTTSIEEAIQHAVTETSKTVKNVEWFEVQETRGHIVDGKVAHYQVVVKVGFRVENS
jgi:flavin-binding protein dodecin